MSLQIGLQKWNLYKSSYEPKLFLSSNLQAFSSPFLIPVKERKRNNKINNLILSQSNYGYITQGLNKD